MSEICNRIPLKSSVSNWQFYTFLSCSVGDSKKLTTDEYILNTNKHTLFRQITWMSTLWTPTLKQSFNMYAFYVRYYWSVVAYTCQFVGWYSMITSKLCNIHDIGTTLGYMNRIWVSEQARSCVIPSKILTKGHYMGILHHCRLSAPSKVCHNSCKLYDNCEKVNICHQIDTMCDRYREMKEKGPATAYFRTFYSNLSSLYNLNGVVIPPSYIKSIITSNLATI